MEKSCKLKHRCETSIHKNFKRSKNTQRDENLLWTQTSVTMNILTGGSLGNLNHNLPLLLMSIRHLLNWWFGYSSFISSFQYLLSWTHSRRNILNLFSRLLSCQFHIHDSALVRCLNVSANVCIFARAYLIIWKIILTAEIHLGFISTF